MSIGLPSEAMTRASECRAAGESPSTRSPETRDDALAFVAGRSYIGLAMPSVLSLPSPSEQAADRLAEAAARAEHDKERVILTRDGKPVAAVVPIEDFEALEAEDEYWSKAADEAVAAWEAHGRPAFRSRISRATWAST
jgi:prevent-host-death family protein